MPFISGIFVSIWHIFELPFIQRSWFRSQVNIETHENQQEITFHEPKCMGSNSVKKSVIYSIWNNVCCSNLCILTAITADLFTQFVLPSYLSMSSSSFQLPGNVMNNRCIRSFFMLHKGLISSTWYQAENVPVLIPDQLIARVAGMLETFWFCQNRIDILITFDQVEKSMMYFFL